MFIILIFPCLVRAVITPASGSVQDNLVVLREGDAIEIRFNITAEPPPTTFTWSRNGVPVGSSNGLTLTQDSFVINTVKEKHNGTYSLKVTNPVGSTYYKFALIVQCKACPPVCVWGGGGGGDAVT